MAYAIGLWLQIERVMHLPGRMLGRDVELGEIIVVELDVGSFGNGKPHVGKDGDGFIQYLGDGVNSAHHLRPQGQ